MNNMKSFLNHPLTLTVGTVGVICLAWVIRLKIAFGCWLCPQFDTIDYIFSALVTLGVFTVPIVALIQKIMKPRTIVNHIEDRNKKS